jgi:hypothetical protein
VALQLFMQVVGEEAAGPLVILALPEDLEEAAQAAIQAGSAPFPGKMERTVLAVVAVVAPTTRLQPAATVATAS